MLCHHLFLGHGDFVPFINQMAVVGKVCVALFVFVSGYGMTRQFGKATQNPERNNFSFIVKFILRRFVKFYMNYWFIFIIMVPIGVFFFSRPLSAAYGTESVVSGLALDFFGLQGFNSYNITWWFNRIIIVLWLMFPLFYWSMKSRITSIPILLLLFINPGDILWPFHFFAYGLPFFMIDFALGIFMAQHIEMISVHLKSYNSAFILSLSLLATFTFLWMRNTELVGILNEYQIDPLIAITLALSAVSFCRFFNSKLSIIAFIGKHSTNIYLTHTFIFLYFFHDVTYSFKYSLPIFSFLLLTSLTVSVFFESCKQHLGFYKLQEKVTDALYTKQNCS